MNIYHAEYATCPRCSNPYVDLDHHGTDMNDCDECGSRFSSGQLESRSIGWWYVLDYPACLTNFTVYGPYASEEAARRAIDGSCQNDANSR